MAFRLERTLVASLMLLNFGLYLAVAALAGSILGRNLNTTVPGLTDERPIGNEVTPIFIPIALIACMTGLASVFAGAQHIRLWRSESRSAATTTSLVAWSLSLLSMGLACEQINFRRRPSKRLEVVEVFVIILPVFELIYLLAIHACFVPRDGYGNAPVSGCTGGQGAPAKGPAPAV